MRALERRAGSTAPSSACPRRRCARAPSGQGLTRPELAVLLAYAKIDLNDEILASDRRTTAARGELIRYFPSRSGRFEPAIRAPPAAPRDRASGRELAGQPLRPTFVRNMGLRTGAPPPRSHAPSPWCATPGSCATCGATSRRSTPRSRPRRRSACWWRRSFPDARGAMDACAACRSRSTRSPRPSSSARRWRRWATCAHQIGDAEVRPSPNGPRPRGNGRAGWRSPPGLLRLTCCCRRPDARRARRNRYSIEAGDPRRSPAQRARSLATLEAVVQKLLREGQLAGQAASCHAGRRRALHADLLYLDIARAAGAEGAADPDVLARWASRASSPSTASTGGLKEGWPRRAHSISPCRRLPRPSCAPSCRDRSSPTSDES